MRLRKLKWILAGTVATLALVPSTPVFAISNPPVQYVINETVNLGNVTTTPVTGCVPQRSTYPFFPKNFCVTLTPSAYGAFSTFQQWIFWCMPYQCVLNATFKGDYGVIGFIRPKYQVIGVYYAPPGALSTVQYGSQTTDIVTTDYQNTYSVENSVSLTEKQTYGIGPWTSGLTTTFTAGMTQESDSSGTLKVMSDKSSTYTLGGPPLINGVDPGVDHSVDVIWVWLNPEINIYASPDQAVTNFFAFDPSDPHGGPSGVDIIWLSVSVLQALASGNTAGCVPCNDTDVQARLQRSWDPMNGALTQADYNTILARDPFIANPNFNPNTDPSNRFSPLTDQSVSNIQYSPTSAACGQTEWLYYSAKATTTTAAGQGGKDTYATTYSVDNSATQGVSVPSIFSANVELDTKNSRTFTWINQWSQSVEDSVAHNADFTIYQPSCTYAGSSQFQVWQDNVYGTFMFY